MFSFVPIHQTPLELQYFSKQIIGDLKYGFTSFLSKNLYDANNLFKPHKVHLNFDNASYVKYREAILHAIDESAENDSIVQFKYYDFSAETISYDSNYQDLCTSINILNELKKGNFSKAEELSAAIIEKKVAVWAADTIKLAKENKFDIADVSLQDLQSLKDAHERFIGQAQFTLYFSQPIDEKKLSTFLVSLNDKLQKLGIKPGTIADTDVKLTPFISFRQLCLNGTINEIAGAGMNTKEYHEKLALLKSQAKESPLFKTLDTALNSTATLEKVTEVKASPNTKPSTVGFFSTATLKKFTPFDFYQAAENEFIKNDFKEAYKLYQLGYQKLRASKIFSVLDANLKLFFVHKISVLTRVHPELKGEDLKKDNAPKA